MLRRLREMKRFRRTVRANVSVGRNFTFGDNSVVWAPRRLVIGNDVSLGSAVRIEVDGSIGDDVLIANGVGIVGRSDHDLTQVGSSIKKSRWVGHYPDDLSQSTRIGSDVWVGYGAIILSGVTIGDSAVVGAGAIVTVDLPANSVSVGSPARVIGERFGAGDFVRHWDILREKGLHRLDE